MLAVPSAAQIKLAATASLLIHRNIKLLILDRLRKSQNTVSKAVKSTYIGLKSSTLHSVD